MCTSGSSRAYITGKYPGYCIGAPISMSLFCYSAWMTVARNTAKYAHIELSHELYTIKKGGFEAIYANCVPRGAGEIMTWVPDDKGEGTGGEWKTVLVPTEKGSRSAGRMQGGP